MNLLQLLKSLQRQRRGLAIVLDEFGGTAGIVTIEDILAEVLGELRREHAPSGPSWKTWAGTAGASAAPCAWTISAANIRPGRICPACETMAGLALRQFEVVPRRGESVVVGGLRLTVRAADERRIRELLVEVVKKKR